MMTLALMLQFVPTIPADPAAAPDPATVVSAIMDQVALAAAPQIHTARFRPVAGARGHSDRLDRIAGRFYRRLPPVGRYSSRHRPLVSVGDAHLL